MNPDELGAKVRTLRAQGRSPKEIARALGVRPADVVPMVRELAREVAATVEEPAVAECWVNSGWSVGLSFEGHPQWSATVTEAETAGLVSVVLARDHRQDKVSVCGYLVDVYCLGVKNAFGPRRMDRQALPDLVSSFFRSYPEPPVAAPLDLAQHLVLGAVEYARRLGFEPHRDFEAARGQLGTWMGPSAVRFGQHGKPLFIQGPDDDPARVLATLERSVGRGNFH